MAKPNKRQAKLNPKLKCEHAGCVVLFGRNSERRRHVREQHGPFIYCYIPGCRWTTRRMGRLRTHLENAHRSEASKDCTLPSEFQTAIAQSLVSPSNYYANINPNSVHTPPPASSDNTFIPQAHEIQVDDSESLAAFNHEAAPHPEYNPTSCSSTASKTRVTVRPSRIFRPCRFRRRTPRATAHTPSSGPPLAHQDSAMESTLRFYPEKQDDSISFSQWMSDPFDVELMASSLWSFSLDYCLSTEPATSQQLQPTPNSSNSTLAQLGRDDRSDRTYVG